MHLAAHIVSSAGRRTALGGELWTRRRPSAGHHVGRQLRLPHLQLAVGTGHHHVGRLLLAGTEVKGQGGLEEATSAELPSTIREQLISESKSTRRNAAVTVASSEDTQSKPHRTWNRSWCHVPLRLGLEMRVLDPPWRSQRRKLWHSLGEDAFKFDIKIAHSGMRMVGRREQRSA